ncbi:MAG: hypothetical protein IT561_12985 [Alphaproteobacteria bacterium]|nr:hypothetical protein [Alphaproteobacteria bacterium]
MHLVTAPATDHGAGPLLLHATTVAVGGVGVVIEGASGAGKSDLALRLIDGGARLVADDQTAIEARAGRLLAAPPVTIAGRLEVRGLGIVTLPYDAEVPVGLFVALVAPESVERLPQPEVRRLRGVAVPLLRLDPFAASAAAKVRLAVANHARQ